MSNPTDCGDAHAAHPDDGDGELDWQRLYEMHAPLLRHHAAKFVDASLVDDIVQETFLRAYRNRHSIRPDRPLGPWLTVIARRAAIDVVRRHSVRVRVSRDVEIPHTRLEPVEDDYFNAVRRTAIKDVLESLNERHRRVLANTILHPEAGMARDALDGSTRSALARARQGFRNRYRELSEKTGVFGSAILAMRRKGASTRDALVRVEGWLQAGMPMLIAACVGASLVGSALSPGVAANGTPSAKADDDTEAVARRTGEGTSSASTMAANSARDSSTGPVDPAVRGSAHQPTASPPMARTSIDWQAGRNRDRGGIYFFQRIETDFMDSRHGNVVEIHCNGGVLAGAACRVFDQVPESRRHHDVGVDEAGGGAHLTR